MVTKQHRQRRESKDITKPRCNPPWTSDVPVARFGIQNSHMGNAREGRHRFSKTTREDLSEMTRHEEGRADGRLASGTGFQLEDRSVPVSGAVSRKAGRRDWQCFHRKEMVSERCIYAHL